MKRCYWYLLGCLLLLLTGCQTPANFDVKQKTFVYEYGDNINRNKTYYLKGKADVLAKLKIDFTSLKKDKYGYVKPGTYRLPIKRSFSDRKVIIKVEDNHKPIIIKEPITIESGTSRKELLTQIEAYDEVGNLQIPLKAKIISPDLALDEEGNTKVKVMVKDTGGNKVYAELPLTITKKTRKVVCELQQQEANFDTQYQYLADENGMVIGERIIIKVAKDDKINSYLINSLEFRKEFENMIRKELGLNEDIAVNYSLVNGSSCLTISLNNAQVLEHHNLDLSKVKMNDLAKELNKLDGYLCHEE